MPSTHTSKKSMVFLVCFISLNMTIIKTRIPQVLVNEFMVRRVSILNLGSSSLRFRIEQPVSARSYVKVSPLSGEVAPGIRAMVDLQFHPQTLMTLEKYCISCKVCGGRTYKLDLHGAAPPAIGLPPSLLSMMYSCYFGHNLCSVMWGTLLEGCRCSGSPPTHFCTHLLAWLSTPYPALAWRRQCHCRREG